MGNLNLPLFCEKQFSVHAKGNAFVGRRARPDFGLQAGGLTISEIAEVVDRSYDVVCKFLKDLEAYGARARPGRSAKVGKRNRRELLRAAK